MKSISVLEPIGQNAADGEDPFYRLNELAAT